MLELLPLGERAWLARFATDDQARGWAASVRHALGAAPGQLDVVLAYRSVAVYLDNPGVDARTLEQRLAEVPILQENASEAAEIGLPVLYNGADLPWVARERNLSVEQVIALHCQTPYRVQALGFLPGFAYCGDLPSELAGLPRRGQPRTHVPAGSVGIVARQTGLYPAESPGGWHLIGQTPLRIVDLEQAYFPIRAGDRIVFRPIDEAEFTALTNDLLRVERPL